MATLLEKCNNIKNDKDTNLKPENLKAGVTCLGVTGTLTELDTSDATATAEDIAIGASAYVNGEKITGTVRTVEAPDNGWGSLANFIDYNTYEPNTAMVQIAAEDDYLIRQGGKLETAIPYATIADTYSITGDKIVAGNTILGVEGTAKISEGDSEGVKLFETVEEMQADTEAEEGDLALVYRNELQPITVDSRFSKAVFPETVVLPNAITDYADLMFRAVDDSIMFECWGQLDASMFMMDCYTETGNTRIQYESSDGITYNRTRLQGDGVDGDSVDFGTEIYYAYPEMWNDAMGYFLQSESANYQGLFEYTLNIKTEYIKIPLRDGIIYKYDSTTSKMIKSWENVLYYDKMFKAADLQAMAKRIVDNEQLENNIFAFYIDPNDNLCMAASHKTDGAPYYYSNTLSNLEYDVNGNFIGCGSTRAGGPNTGADYAMDIYHIDLENKTYNFVERVNMVKKVIANGVWKMTYGIPSKTTIVKVYPNNNTMIDTDTALFCTYGSDDVSIENLNGLNEAVLDTWLYKDMYIAAPNQFDVEIKDILPGKICYGANGVVIGDNSIYNNLDINAFNPNETFTDFSAGVYAKAKALYKDLKPIVLTDRNQVDKTIYIIPKNENNELLIDHSQISDLSFMYQSANNLIRVEGFENNIATNACGLFSGCSNLEYVDISGLTSQNLTNIRQMFTQCHKLKTAILGPCCSVATTSITDLFASCHALTKVDVSQFNTSNITNFTSMFHDCNSLVELDLSNFNTEKVTDFDWMFYNCTSLKKLDLSSFVFSGQQASSAWMTFTGIPSDCLIYVKDQTAKDWILTVRSDFTNVQIKNIGGGEEQ